MQRCITLVLVLLTLGTSAQKIIKGKVKDAQGPLTGVSVIEKETPTNGATTNDKGEFQLPIKGTSGIFIFSSQGYLTREVNLLQRSVPDIILQPDSKGLEDVVVVAYGTQKKFTKTGSVSSVSGAEIRQTPSASLQNALMGRVSGFTSQQRSGAPGSDGAAFLIRGLSTPNGNGQPLIVIDDVEYTGSFSDIDPDQVESLSILKDASTTAVYGVKGANGVIVITTRRGKSGKPQIAFRSETGIQTPTFEPDFLGSYDVARLRNQALVSDGSQPLFTNEDLELFRNGTDPYGHPNVNWYKELIRKNSLMNRQNVTIQGGLAKAKYFISAGYLSQDGLLKDFSNISDEVKSNYQYKRYNFRSNLDIQASKTLQLSLDLSGSLDQTRSPNVGGRNSFNNIFFELTDYGQLPPFAYAPINPDGSFGANNTNSSYQNNVIGRIALGGYRQAFENFFTTNFRATQKLDFITKGLSLRGTVSYTGEFGYNRDLTRTPAGFPSYNYNARTDVYTPYNANITRISKLTLSYAEGGNQSVKRLNYQAAVNYDRTFGEHHVYALGLLNQSTELIGVGSPDNYRGLTARAGYDFRQKYLVEFNAGYNGTDRFVKGKRYGFFPAGSVGWNIAEEQFFKKAVPFINLLKLRASYGITGSDDVGGQQYIYLSTYDRSGTWSLGENHRPVLPIIEGALGNDNVTWEKEKQSNIGLDLNLFKGKISITADVFNRYRYDILMNRGTVSQVIGVGLTPANIGIVRNKGFEMDLTYRSRIGSQFNYTLKGNASFSKNKVLNIDEATPPYPWLALTGNSLNSVTGYTFLGFYSEAEIADARVAKPAAGAKAGDLKYLDRTGEGIVDPNDRTVQPLTNLPNTILGFTPGFTWKNFSFSATFQSALNFGLSGQNERIAAFTGNLRAIHLDAWTPENSVNPSYPRLTTIANSSSPVNYPSDYWFIRGDYLRLKSAEIGYRLPQALMRKLRLADVRLYANGFNLLTWALVEKNIYDIDPETISQDGGSAYYPQQRVYNFGLQVSL